MYHKFHSLTLIAVKHEVRSFLTNHPFHSIQDITLLEVTELMLICLLNNRNYASKWNYSMNRTKYLK
jgi:hypothetical protein